MLAKLLDCTMYSYVVPIKRNVSNYCTIQSLDHEPESLNVPYL